MNAMLVLVWVHPAGTSPPIVRALSEEEGESLVNHYVGGDTSPLARRCLETAWRQRQWFACCCRPAGQRPPLLFARQPAAGVYVLVGMTDRPPHAPSCPFACDPYIATANATTPALPDLAHLLFRWFSGARLNLLYPYDADDLVQTQYVALRETAKSLHLSPGRRLYDYSRTHPDGLPELFRRLAIDRTGERCEASAWGAYLAVVSALGPSTLCSALGSYGQAARVLDAPLLQLPVTLDNAGPHAVLFALAPQTPPHTSIQAVRIFAHPVYSRRQLIPLEAAHERHTLALLLEVQRAFLVSHQLVVTIRKTLPEMAVHERGIAFQVSVLGPNGQALRQLDIVSLSAADVEQPTPALEDWQRAVLERASGEVLYHAACLDAGTTASDEVFSEALATRLLEPLASSRHTRRAPACGVLG